MNIGEIKEKIADFIAKIGIYQDFSAESLSNLSQFFEEYDNDVVFAGKEKYRVGLKFREAVLEFWEQAQLYIPREAWETHPVVVAGLDLQEELKELKWSLSTAHHGYFYHFLEQEYNECGNQQTTLEKFMPIIKSCCRMLGYAHKDDVNYPISRIQTKIEQVRESPRTKEALQAIITCYGVIFVLLQDLYPAAVTTSKPFNRLSSQHNR